MIKKTFCPNPDLDRIPKTKNKLTTVHSTADWIKATLGSSYMNNVTCVKEFSVNFEELVKTYNDTIPDFKRYENVYHGA